MLKGPKIYRQWAIKYAVHTSRLLISSSDIILIQEPVSIMAVSCTAHQPTGLPTSEQYKWLMRVFGEEPKWFIETPIAGDEYSKYYHSKENHNFGEVQLLYVHAHVYALLVLLRLRTAYFRALGEQKRVIWTTALALVDGVAGSY